MGEYIEYVADTLLVCLDVPARYATVNPASVLDESEPLCVR